MEHSEVDESSQLVWSDVDVVTRWMVAIVGVAGVLLGVGTLSLGVMFFLLGNMGLIAGGIMFLFGAVFVVAGGVGLWKKTRLLRGLLLSTNMVGLLVGVSCVFFGVSNVLVAVAHLWDEGVFQQSVTVFELLFFFVPVKADAQTSSPEVVALMGNSAFLLAGVAFLLSGVAVVVVSVRMRGVYGDLVRRGQVVRSGFQGVLGALWEGSVSKGRTGFKIVKVMVAILGAWRFSTGLFILLESLWEFDTQIGGIAVGLTVLAVASGLVVVVSGVGGHRVWMYVGSLLLLLSGAALVFWMRNFIVVSLFSGLSVIFSGLGLFLVSVGWGQRAKFLGRGVVFLGVAFASKGLALVGGSVGVLLAGEGDVLVNVAFLCGGVSLLLGGVAVFSLIVHARRKYQDSEVGGHVARPFFQEAVEDMWEEPGVRGGWALGVVNAGLAVLSMVTAMSGPFFLLFSLLALVAGSPRDPSSVEEGASTGGAAPILVFIGIAFVFMGLASLMLLIGLSKDRKALRSGFKFLGTAFFLFGVSLWLVGAVIWGEQSLVGLSIVLVGVGLICGGGASVGAGSRLEYEGALVNGRNLPKWRMGDVVQSEDPELVGWSDVDVVTRVMVTLLGGAGVFAGTFLFILGLFLILLCGLVWYETARYPGDLLDARRLTGPGTFPRLLASLLGLAGAWETLRGLFHGKRDSVPQEPLSHSGFVNILCVVFVTTAFIPLTHHLGFSLGALACILPLMLRFRVRPALAILASCLTIGLIFLMFNGVFRVQLPRGALTEPMGWRF